MSLFWFPLLVLSLFIFFRFFPFRLTYNKTTTVTIKSPVGVTATVVVSETLSVERVEALCTSFVCPVCHTETVLRNDDDMIPVCFLEPSTAQALSCNYGGFLVSKSRWAISLEGTHFYLCCASIRCSSIGKSTFVGKLTPYNRRLYVYPNEGHKVGRYMVLEPVLLSEFDGVDKVA